MESTVTGGVREHFEEICKRAVGQLGRKGVFHWVERDELISTGYLALAALDTEPDEALAVIVARRAMIGAVRKNERRNRGRVDDPIEALPGVRLRPEGAHVDLWEAMKALPSRQYQAVMLTYWGGQSESAVAVEMGVSHQAVHALIEKAKINIRMGVAIPLPRAITNMRGTEARRTALSSRAEAE